MINEMDASKVLLGEITAFSSTVELLLELNSQEINQVDLFLANSQSFLSLQMLLQLYTKKICFYEKEVASLEYMKLILELISICESPQEFVSRIFSRKMKEEINVANQYRYLKQEWDEELYEESMKALSEEGRLRFVFFFQDFHQGSILFPNRYCRRFLPTWPPQENLPCSFEGSRGVNTLGELEPNTNTLFYGQGFLKEQRTYQHLRTLLQEAEIKYLEAFPFEEGAEDWMNSLETIALSLPLKLEAEEWEKILLQIKKEKKKQELNIHILSAEYGVSTI